VRDFVEVAGESRISAAGARGSLDKLEVDHFGLDELDRRILGTIVERFGGGPVGLSALAHSLGEDKGTLEDLYEPFLLQSGFLTRTPKGRVATALAYRHLGLPPRVPGQGPLFDGAA
jgi:holliday junction DNA helicase RuvB